MTKIIRTYSELMSIPTFIERYRYLRLGGQVGEETFGFDRYINQLFYTSDEWKAVRRQVIIRDTGRNDYCQDLGMDYDHDISGRIIVHHMNPILIDDIVRKSDFLLNPEYLICTSKDTHDAIHYGNEDLLAKPLVERMRNDTCPWRR